MELVIERAGLEDHGIVAELILEFTETVGARVSDLDRFDLMVASLLKNNSWLFLKASVGSEPCGFAAVEFRHEITGEQTATLSALFVRGQYRREGIGTALLKQAVAHAERRGCSKVEAALLEGHLTGDFLSRFGFSRSGEIMAVRLYEG